MSSTSFNHPQFTIRQKVLAIFGAKFHVFDPNGQLLLFCKQKAFKLKEDVRLFSDETMTTELMAIRTESILDISGSYAIIDSQRNVTLAYARRQGLKSIVKDSWTICDATGREVGKIVEDSTSAAIMRRLIGPLTQLFMPQGHTLEINGVPICRLQQNRNPFVRKVVVDLSADRANVLDRRVGIAIALILMIIESRQQ
jgi:uncharacterized protein YxjI